MSHLGFLSVPGTGHLNPLAALGRRLQQRGHPLALTAQVKEINLTDNMQPEAKPKSKELGAGVAKIADLVSYQDGSIVSREIVRKPTGNATVFAFDEGQGLSEHTAPFDALVQVLEGEVEITIAGKTYRLRSGELILMPAQQAACAEGGAALQNDPHDDSVLRLSALELTRDSSSHRRPSMLATR
jgi:quercetin dioxygenase-like cupin family protein